MSDPGEGGIHVVAAGEWISKIAATYGIGDWRNVWDAPENAELRKLRPDPNLIHPGDEVYIPPIVSNSYDRATDQKHVFVLKRRRKRLKIRFETTTGAARAHVPCLLEIDHKPRPDVTETDARGMIDVDVSDTADTGTILLGEYRSECYEIKLGYLDPLDTVRGYQERLQNLGHYAGEIDGLVGPKTKAAIRQFQTRENLLGYSPALKVDGIVGPKTLDALRRRHGY